MYMRKLYGIWLEDGNLLSPTIITRALKVSITEDDASVVEDVLLGQELTDEHRKLLNWCDAPTVLKTWLTSAVIAPEDLDVIFSRLSNNRWKKVLDTFEPRRRGHGLPSSLGKRLWAQGADEPTLRLHVILATDKVEEAWLEWVTKATKEGKLPYHAKVNFYRVLDERYHTKASAMAIEVDQAEVYHAVMREAGSAADLTEAAWRCVQRRGGVDAYPKREKAALVGLTTILVEMTKKTSALPYSTWEIMEKAREVLDVTSSTGVAAAHLRNILPKETISRSEYDKLLEDIDGGEVTDEMIRVVNHVSYRSSDLRTKVETHPRLTPEQGVMLARPRHLRTSAKVDSGVFPGRGLEWVKELLTIAKAQSGILPYTVVGEEALRHSDREVVTQLKAHVASQADGLRDIKSMNAMDTTLALLAKVQPLGVDVDITHEYELLGKMLNEHLGEDEDRWALFEELQVTYTGTFGELFEAINTLVSN